MYAQNAEDARDLLQDTLANLWNGFSRFREESSTRTWVIRITINTCISFRRKRKADTTSADFLPRVADASAEASAQIKMLHSRLQKLDYLDRALVMLWLEDLTYDEIGAIAGISAKSVGVRLVRIKNKLKNINDDE